jgi:hypothetical protein
VERGVRCLVLCWRDGEEWWSELYIYNTFGGTVVVEMWF